MREVFEIMDVILKTVIEGLGLGALLFLVCAVGIRKGAVGIILNNVDFHSLMGWFDAV